MLFYELTRLTFPSSSRVINSRSSFNIDRVDVGIWNGKNLYRFDGRIKKKKKESKKVSHRIFLIPIDDYSFKNIYIYIYYRHASTIQCYENQDSFRLYRVVNRNWIIESNRRMLTNGSRAVPRRSIASGNSTRLDKNTRCCRVSKRLHPS